jgi:hypothetical protein
MGPQAGRSDVHATFREATEARHLAPDGTGAYIQNFFGRLPECLSSGLAGPLPPRLALERVRLAKGARRIL